MGTPIGGCSRGLRQGFPRWAPLQLSGFKMCLVEISLRLKHWLLVTQQAQVRFPRHRNGFLLSNLGYKGLGSYKTYKARHDVCVLQCFHCRQTILATSSMGDGRVREWNGTTKNAQKQFLCGLFIFFIRSKKVMGSWLNSLIAPSPLLPVLKQTKTSSLNSFFPFNSKRTFVALS